MPVSHAQAKVSSLLEMIAGITDPRDPRGVRHPLVAVLGVAVLVTLAGAANYREMGSTAADLPQRLLDLLRCRRHPVSGRCLAPSAATLRRVLIEVDADALDAAVGAWLRRHAACHAQGWTIALDGKDLHGSWNADGRLVLFSAMTHRRDGQDAIVLGQVAVPTDTTETTQVRTLLETMELDLTGALVTADAAHTCAETARYLVEEANADYLLAVKGNRSSLYAAAVTAARDLIAGDPHHVITERGHGRINRWATWAATIDEDLGLPHAARLAVIRRDVADLAGSPRSKEVVIMITSRAHLSAAEISAHTRTHWGIENLEHRSRDTVWLEDDHQAYLGHGPRVLATLRNLALGLFSIHGISKIKETVQAIGRNPLRAIPLITQSHIEPSTVRL
ncbi:ISAs1 family transposase [Nonomuraea sp. NPDC049158]|uniref:ISAs1 family transposase n=1 Tax=Nonomuraea sp. NPDC049158 TaxID=3155649 RepID=UPI0033F3AEDC